MLVRRPIELELIDLVEQLFRNADSRAHRQAVIGAIGPIDQFRKRPQNPHEAYARNVIYSTPTLEIMIASWTQNQECLPHDHGASNGMVINLSGRFEETAYQWQTGLLIPTGSTVHGVVNSLIEVNIAHIHSMHCKDEGGLTLHMYAPAIQNMKVFDLNLRRTLVVANNCGAWVPLDPSQIQAIQNWNQG